MTRSEAHPRICTHCSLDPSSIYGQTSKRRMFGKVTSQVKRTDSEILFSTLLLNQSSKTLSRQNKSNFCSTYDKLIYGSPSLFFAHTLSFFVVVVGHMNKHKFAQENDDRKVILHVCRTISDDFKQQHQSSFAFRLHNLALNLGNF